jgi:hypothetical protein
MVKSGPRPHPYARTHTPAPLYPHPYGDDFNCLRILLNDWGVILR